MPQVGQTIIGGYTFAGKTGEETGQNLENMAEKSTLVSGSDFLDGITLDTVASATLTDKDGNPIYQGQIKDLGVSTGKIAAEAVTNAKILNGMFAGMPLIAMDNTNFTFNNQAAIDNADLDVITTADNTTLQATAKTITSLGSIYTDIGSVSRGWFMFKIRFSTITGTTRINVIPWHTYNAPTFNADQPAAAWYHQGIGNDNGLYIQTPVLNEDYIVTVPIHGRYCGVIFKYAGTAPQFKFSRWAVVAEAADPGI